LEERERRQQQIKDETARVKTMKEQLTALKPTTLARRAKMAGISKHVWQKALDDKKDAKKALINAIVEASFVDNWLTSQMHTKKTIKKLRKVNPNAKARTKADAIVADDVQLDELFGLIDD
jgi:hypothetical protein